MRATPTRPGETKQLQILQTLTRDTDVVASWLAAAAKQRGYTASLVVPPTAIVPANRSATPFSDRLKGKSRKEAKKQQQQHATLVRVDTQDAPDPPGKPKYVLAIRDFVPLAEFIAGKLRTTQTAPDNEGRVPAFFRMALQRVIRVRKAVSMRLSKDKQHLNVRANATHTHFVSVLEKVQNILLEADGSSNAFNMASLKQSTNAVRDDSTKKAKARDFNLFDVLQVYEPSDDFLNAPEVVLSAPPLPFDLEYTAEGDDSEAEHLDAPRFLLRSRTKTFS